MPPPTPTVAGRAAAVLVAAVCTAALLAGPSLPQGAIAASVGVLQLAMVLVFRLHRRPPGPMVTIGCGIGAAIAADAIAQLTQPMSLDALVYVLAGAFGVSIAGQIGRVSDRSQSTVSMGSAMLVAVLSCGYAAWIGLARTTDGQTSLWICAIAVGAAVMAARACDVTLPKPRVNRQVPRGAFGIVIGAMVGTAAATYAAVVLDGPDPQRAAIGGFAIALVGVLADLATGYLQAGRRIAVDGVAGWAVRHTVGPLLAFGAAAPMAYLLSVYYKVGL